MVDAGERARGGGGGLGVRDTPGAQGESGGVNRQRRG